MDRSQAIHAGRCTAIAFDPVRPNCIWVGSPTGGVRRSDDGGHTWRAVHYPAANLSVNVLAVDRQSRVYVGTGSTLALGHSLSGAGLLFSDDGGENWTLQEAPFGTGAIASIIVDPADDAHVTVAAGTGVFESTDRAVNWTPITPGFGGEAVAAVIDPVNGPGTERLYVAYKHGELWRRTTTPALAEIDVLATATGLESMRTGARVAALALSPSRFTRTDGVQERLLYVRVSDGTAASELYVSEDAGVSFTRTFLGSSDHPFAFHALAVHPDHPEMVFEGTLNIARSTDRGRNWTPLGRKRPNSPEVHVDQLVLAFNPHDKRLWAGNDGGVWVRTQDDDADSHADEIWSSRGRGLQSMQLYVVDHHPVADRAVLVGAQDNGGQRSSGHPGFVEVGSGDGFGVAVEADAPAGERRAWYYSPQAGPSHENPGFSSVSLERSVKGGLPDAPDADEDSDVWWVPHDSGLKRLYGGFIVHFAPDPARPGVLFLAAEGIYASRNRAVDWEPVKAGTGEVTALGPASTGQRLRVYAGFEVECPVGSCAEGSLVVGMVRCFDFEPATRQWRARADVLGPFTTFHEENADRASAIAVVPRDAPAHDRVYVAIGGALDRRVAHAVATPVWRSDDGGRNWTPASTGLPPGNFVNCLALDRAVPDRIFAGCDAGVFRSDDGGASWRPFSEGLPRVPVFDLKIHPVTGMLRAATFGWSVWERHIDSLAPDPPPDAHLFLRDLAAFSRPVSIPIAAPVPAYEGDLWRRGADLKLQLRGDGGEFEAAASTVDHEPGGAPDYFAFESFSEGEPRSDESVRVHLQVHNRGPAIARSVRARVFWAARAGSGYPDLDPDFWPAFGQNRTSAGAWTPIGETRTLAEVLPGEPAVATWTWTVPDAVPRRAALLAVVTSPDDSNDETGLAIAHVARFNEKVLLKEITTTSWAREHWKAIAIVLGVAVLGAGVAVAVKKS